MKFWFLSLLAVLGVISAQAHAGSQDILIKDAYAYASAPSQKNGAVFMKIENHTGQEYKVISAASDAAEQVELHTHSMDGGIMMMREVSHYALPSGEVTHLEPSGHHIMLMGLSEPLVAGEHFSMTLEIQDHDTIEVDVIVTAPGEGL